MNQGQPHRKSPRDPRFEKAIAEAQEAFWESFAQRFPEIRTGDLDPLAQFSFSEAAEKAGKAWLDANGYRPRSGMER